MDWSILLTLLCPLMMIFCMKGMFSGHHCGDAKDKMEQAQVSAEEFQVLQNKMNELTEQNAHLLQEIQSLKQSRANAEG